MGDAGVAQTLILIAHEHTHTGQFLTRSIIHTWSCMWSCGAVTSLPWMGTGLCSMHPILAIDALPPPSLTRSLAVCSLQPVWPGGLWAVVVVGVVRVGVSQHTPHPQRPQLIVPAPAVPHRLLPALPACPTSAAAWTGPDAWTPWATLGPSLCIHRRNP